MTEPAKAEHVGGVLDVLAYIGDNNELPASGVDAGFVREVKAAWRAEVGRLRTIEAAAVEYIDSGRWVNVGRLRAALAAPSPVLQAEETGP